LVAGSIPVSRSRHCQRLIVNKTALKAILLERRFLCEGD
jgi:hypothetical protein